MHAGRGQPRPTPSGPEGEGLPTAEQTLQRAARSVRAAHPGLAVEDLLLTDPPVTALLEAAGQAQMLVLGLQQYDRRDLEAVRAAGQRLQIRVLGLATIADDVSPELALDTIDSIRSPRNSRWTPSTASACSGLSTPATR